jgi:hypothetical protein
MAWRVLSSATAVDLWAFGNPNPNGEASQPERAFRQACTSRARPFGAATFDLAKSTPHALFVAPAWRELLTTEERYVDDMRQCIKVASPSTLHVGNKHTTWKIARRNTWRGVGGRSRDIATRRTQQHSALRGATWAQGEAPATQPCMRRRSSARSRRSGMSSPAETGTLHLVGARRAFLRDNLEYSNDRARWTVRTETGTSPPRLRAGGGGAGAHCRPRNAPT